MIGTRFLFGVMECSGIRGDGWLHNIVNAPTVTELFT